MYRQKNSSAEKETFKNLFDFLRKMLEGCEGTERWRNVNRDF